MTTQHSAPLALTDEQMRLVQAGGEPIRHALRDSYLRAAALGREPKPLTNRVAHAAVAKAQHKVLNLPRTPLLPDE
jgi:hypothetical protein